MAAENKEIEIKFRVNDLQALTRQLEPAGFRLVTKRTHEMNTLYDLPNGVLRERKELLRLRQYGEKWTLTHKSGKNIDKHSSRVELETTVGDGERMDLILRALGYVPSFRYEKFRGEWTDGKGQILVDETPIGNFCEIEGAPEWIDETARALEVSEAHYITQNYAGLFEEWKARNGNVSNEMTFRAIATLK